ncbi:MAG: hypothetical protein HWD58_11155 [Bacteroidota bacterium]|nr:MAG: hypothetical protein HWD58_11155 [Bacteroidota bacterium]
MWRSNTEIVLKPEFKSGHDIRKQQLLFYYALSQAYGSNQVQVENGIWALYSGDINQDGVVDGLDYNDWESDNNNFGAGYLAIDLNGDGIVDGLDFLLWK